MQKNFKWGWSFLLIGMIGLMALVPLYQFSTTQSLQNAIFLNPNYPIPARVDDLISRLTLSEKNQYVNFGFTRNSWTRYSRIVARE